MAPSPAMEESHRVSGPRTALAGSCASSLHLHLSCSHHWARPRRPPRRYVRRSGLLVTVCRSRRATTCNGSSIAHHRRSTFCFASGVYQLSGTVWTGSKFPRLDLRAGAVIDGQNGAFVGINGADAPRDQRGTVILGGVFQHFGNEAPRPGCRLSSSVATGWSWGLSSRTTSTPDSGSRAMGRACPESTRITTADMAWS